MSISLKNNIFNLSEGSVYKRLRPTNISVSVLSATSAKLTWANSNNRSDGIRVYSSTDGVNYSRVGSDLPIDTTSYIHNSIDTGSDRYWYVVYFKGPIEGSPSSVVKLDWFTIEFDSMWYNSIYLDRIDCVAGDGITIFWGDGTSDSYTSVDNGTMKTHEYSDSSIWIVKITNPLNISYISLNNRQIVNFNTNQFLKCKNNLIGINLSGLGEGAIVNSSDLAHLKLSTILRLEYGMISGDGIYIINSEHFKNYLLSETCYLGLEREGTYTINSEHFKNYTLNDTLFLWLADGKYIINSEHFKDYTLNNSLILDTPYECSTCTYIINSEHFKNYLLSDNLNLTFRENGIYVINTSHFKNYTVNNYQLSFNKTNITKTISRNDFANLLKVNSYWFEMGLTQSEIDTILLGIYDAFPYKTNSGGSIRIIGHVNPSGIYRAACPPTTGKEAAYELLHDSCDISDYHWEIVDVV